MTSVTSAAQDIKQQAEIAVVKATPTIARLVRLGYAAKGFVYCLIGLLALMTAFGPSGDTTGSRGAMQTLLEKPYGSPLLLVLAVGLAAYSLWQFFRAATDPEHSDKGPKAWARRASYLLSGLIHAGLVLAAVKMVMGSSPSGGSDEDRNAQDWTAKLFSYPFGRVLAGAVGAGITCFGILQIRKGYRIDLDKQLSLGSMSPTGHRLTIFASRLGLAARGLVFAIIGTLLMIAAYRENPREAKGIGGALDALQRQPYGPWLLAAVAIGLFAYGVYLFVRARYRRIELS